MQIKCTGWHPPDGSPPLDAYQLEQGGLHLVTLPARGGKIVSLLDSESGMEWLWLNPALPWREPEPGDSYIERHDLGGWDECFPTVAPTIVDGIAWPDHGDLWSREWESAVRGETLWMGVTDERYAFERSISPAPSGFRLVYRVENRSRVPLSYLWCAHPLFLIDPPLQLEIEGRPEIRLGNDSPLGRMGERHRWPEIQERKVDQVGKPSEMAVKLFVAVESGAIRILRQDGPCLVLRWSREQLPILGLWLNEGGWSGAPDLPPYYNCGIEPASGAPDDLAVALDEWQCAQTLEPGESHSWWLELTLAP